MSYYPITIPIIKQALSSRRWRNIRNEFTKMPDELLLKYLHIFYSIKGLISKCPFGVFKSSKKPKKKNSRISALVSKMRSNKKIRELYTAIIGGFYFGSPTLLFWFDLFLEARAEILEKIVGFLGDLKSPKGHFEINWPLSLL